MAEAVTLNGLSSVTENVSDEILGIVVGIGFTFALFAAIAGFENSETTAPPEEIENLRQMSIPPDAPPPKVTETTASEMPSSPLVGIEIAASDSPVKISVMPPDLAVFIADAPIAPSAVIQSGQLYAGFKPQIDIEAGDFNRVFQQSEVDQKPIVLARPNPHVPSVVRGRAKSLRVSLLIVVNAKGGVDSVRVLDTSGNANFDQIVINDVREAWVFQPAAKKGRKVKCLLQQAVRVSWESGSPFEN